MLSIVVKLLRVRFSYPWVGRGEFSTHLCKHITGRINPGKPKKLNVSKQVPQLVEVLLAWLPGANAFLWALPCTPRACPLPDSSCPPQPPPILGPSLGVLGPKASRRAG